MRRSLEERKVRLAMEFDVPGFKQIFFVVAGDSFPRFEKNLGTVDQLVSLNASSSGYNTYCVPPGTRNGTEIFEKIKAFKPNFRIVA